jgi:hypothetical protein
MQRAQQRRERFRERCGLPRGKGVDGPQQLIRCGPRRPPRQPTPAGCRVHADTTSIDWIDHSAHQSFALEPGKHGGDGALSRSGERGHFVYRQRSLTRDKTEQGDLSVGPPRSALDGTRRTVERVHKAADRGKGSVSRRWFDVWHAGKLRQPRKQAVTNAANRGIYRRRYNWSISRDAYSLSPTASLSLRAG